MEPPAEHRSRLLPPDPEAIRAARVTPRKPKARGLPILGIALLAGIALAFAGSRGTAAADSEPAASVAEGLLEIDASGPHAEAVVVVRWSGDPEAVNEDRAKAARHAVVAWLRDRSPSELAAAPDDPNRQALRAAVQRALFPDGGGLIDQLALRSLRVR